MKAVLLALLCIASASCSIVPTPMRGKGGSVAHALLFGGKGGLTYLADGSAAFTYDNEVSFQHGAQALTTLGVSYISYLGTLAAEVTKRFEMAQITIQQRDAALAAIKQAEIAYKTTGITTLNPNVIPK